MKKILALLMALVMALGCAGAFAEDAQSNEITFELPAFTLAFETNVDTEALTALLPMFGVDESQIAMIQAILPLLADLNGQIVFANNGLQLDLGLKGQTVITAAGEQTEEGFAVASDILPSYVLTVANETIEELMKQYTAQTEDILSNVDMNALVENMMGYAMEYAGVFTQAVTMGEPEMGEYVFEDMDLTFNCKMPIAVDMEAIKAGAEKMIEQIKADESLASLISAMENAGVPVEMAEETEFIVPEVTVNAYANVDEEGNSLDDVTLVTVETATTVEETTENVDVCVLVEGQNVTVHVEFPAEEILFSVYVEPTDEGASVYVMFDGMGIVAAESTVVSLGEALQIYTESYLNDLDNPISKELVSFFQGGERTFAVLDENKTVIGVEQLMSDTEGEVSGALLADVMNNGLGALIAKVSQILPEEMANLMNMMYPAEAVEGAAE